MGLITKGEVVVAPFPLCDLDGRGVYPTTGGIAVTSPQEFTPTCPICNEPVLLETCKADEQGQAVHEHCYAVKVTQHQAPAPRES